MPDLEIDNTATQIVQSLQTAIAAATVDGKAVFRKVLMVDDQDSFVGVADPMKGPVAGLVVPQPEERPGTNADEDAILFMQVDVLVRFVSKRSPGGDESAATADMSRYAQIVRKAVMADPWRDGLARMIPFDGRAIRGTDTNGRPRLIGRDSNQAFFTMAVPIGVGWIRPRT